MGQTIEKQIALLERMTVGDLRDKYVELYGDSTNTKNRAWLVKRLAWRIQALAEGGLSERARQRAEEIANEADLRLSPPKLKPTLTPNVTAPSVDPNDPRLPVPGTIITRTYKKRQLQVRVLADGFEFEGERFSSLSAIAKSITGTHTNGFLFFRLRPEDRR